MRHLVCAALASLLSAAPQAPGPQSAAAEKTVTPPPSVTTEGIPPIPQSIADGVAKYTQFRQAQMIAWHPTKRQILITTAMGSTTQLYSVDGPGRDRHQLTWYEPRGIPATVAASFDPTDPGSFVFQFDPDGNELEAIWEPGPSELERMRASGIDTLPRLEH